MKSISLLFLAVTVFGFVFGSAARAECDRPWVFSDLGEDTLIYTDETDAGGDLIQMRWMPEALSYVTSLRRHGYHFGLIINLPEDWGRTDEEKIAKLERYLTDRWENGATPFDPTLFDAGMLVSPTNDRRKDVSSYLFEKAAALAAGEGCKAVYFTTLSNEIDNARSAGLAVFQVSKTAARNRYLPEARLKAFADEHAGR